ncbi:MAG: Rpn family recombination-promoting nuclease/putative transposase [Lachnospiraceae bacterium]|nr:Rpn family recombination-promoting nuclease/putative transposase [Lachnospiraceae bacterium]
MKQKPVIHFPETRQATAFIDAGVQPHQTLPDSLAFFRDAHGPVPYGMTNDYMFRAVLQSNNKVLRGLVCSLLHLSEKTVVSMEITNPVILGEAVTDKEFRLDINVILNNHALINLEMQIANKLNWKERSVMYLCRSFDQLNRGQDYPEAKPAIHIGFLDYTLFEGQPEFYASYKLVNVKNYQKYSDSLTLNVVDLSRIDLATEEDKKYHIHEWAMLFKATTWEEIKMLASKDEYLQEASETIYRMSADDLVRKRCRDREEYYQDLRNYERKIEQDRLEHEQDLRNYERKIEQDRLEHEQDRRNYERKIEQDRLALAERDAQIQQLRAEIEALKAQGK